MLFVYKLFCFAYICKQKKTNEQIYYSYTTSRSKKDVWI